MKQRFHKILVTVQNHFDLRFRRGMSSARTKRVVTNSMRHMMSSSRQKQRFQDASAMERVHRISCNYELRRIGSKVWNRSFYRILILLSTSRARNSYEYFIFSVLPSQAQDAGSHRSLQQRYFHFYKYGHI